MNRIRQPSQPSDEAPEPIGVPVPRDTVEDPYPPPPSQAELEIIEECAKQLSALWNHQRDGMSRLREIVNQAAR